MRLDRRTVGLRSAALTAAGVTAVCTAVALSVPGHAQQEPYFDPAASSVAFDGSAIVVTFTEVALPPRAHVDVSVTATVAVTTECVSRDPSRRVVFTTTSHASVGDTRTYEAGADGRLAATRTFPASPGRVEAGGLNCDLRETTTLTAEVVDLTYGPTLTLEG